MTNTMYLHSTSRSSEHENEYEEGGWQSIRSRCCQQVISIMMNGRGASLSHDIGEVIRDKLHSRELKKHNVNHNYGNLHQYSMQHCTSSNPLMLNVASANRPNHVTRPAVKQLPHSPSWGNSLKIAQSPHHTCSAEWRRIQMGDIRIYNHSACVGYTPTCTGEKVEHTLDRSQVNHRTKRTARQPRRYLYTFGAVGGNSNTQRTPTGCVLHSKTQVGLNTAFDWSMWRPQPLASSESVHVTLFVTTRAVYGHKIPALINSDSQGPHFIHFWFRL